MPRGIYVVDGSIEEAQEIIQKLEERGTLEKLEKMDNWYDFLFVLLTKQCCSCLCHTFSVR